MFCSACKCSPNYISRPRPLLLALCVNDILYYLMLQPGQVDPEERFTRLEKIGKGSFGEVFKGIDQKDKKTVAIKIIGKFSQASDS